MIRHLITGLFCGLIISNAFASPLSIQIKPHIISDRCESLPCPVDDLTLLGAWELTAENPRFGGLSGLDVTGDGERLYAVTDRGFFLDATLHWDQHRLRAIDVNVFGPIPTSYKESMHKDAEAIVKYAEDAFFIAYERIHRLERMFKHPETNRYTTNAMVFDAHISDQLNHNGGIESIILQPDGSLLIFAEDSLNEKNQIIGWRFSNDSPPEPINYPHYKDFALTDATRLPSGDLLFLERSFGIFSGLKHRILRVSDPEIFPGSTLDAEELAFLDNDMNIDNAEGLASFQRDGRTYLLTLSDNNFKAFQKTVLALFLLND